MFLKANYIWLSMMVVTEWLLWTKISPTSHQARKCNCLVVSCVTTLSCKPKWKSTRALVLFQLSTRVHRMNCKHTFKLLATGFLPTWEAQQLPWLPQALCLLFTGMWWPVDQALVEVQGTCWLCYWGFEKREELASANQGFGCQASLCNLFCSL